LSPDCSKPTAGLRRNLLAYITTSFAVATCSPLCSARTSGARIRSVYIARGSGPILQVTGNNRHGNHPPTASSARTAAVFSDEIWVGNLLPLARTRKTSGDLFGAGPAVKEFRSGFASRRAICVRIRQPFSRVAFDKAMHGPFSRTSGGPGIAFSLLADVTVSREDVLPPPAHSMAIPGGGALHGELKIILGPGLQGGRITRAHAALRETLAARGRRGGLRAMIARSDQDAERWKPGSSHSSPDWYAALHWCTHLPPGLPKPFREPPWAWPFQCRRMHPSLRISNCARHFDALTVAGAIAVDRLKLPEAAWTISA